MISDILLKMQASGMEIDLEQEKIDQIKSHTEHYYEHGLTPVQIFQHLREDVNKVGTPLPLSKVKQLIAQTYRECISSNNLNEALKNLYIANPSVYLNKYADETRTWGKVPVLRTGIDKLDTASGGGLLPGQLLVITGGEGSMKTSLSLKMIDTYLQEVAEKVLYFSLDMEAERVVFRRLLPLMGMGYKSAIGEMQKGTDEYLEAVAKREEIDNGNFRIVDGPHDLEKIKTVIEFEAPSVVVIDYLTCIEGFRSELDCAREAIKRIREWKREYGITFVTLNQLSEASKANQRQGYLNPPAMGGGSSQQASDVKIDLLKDMPAQDEEWLQTRPRIIATISKTRDEVAGRSFDLEYSGQTMSFTGNCKEVFRIKEQKAVFASCELPI